MQALVEQLWSIFPAERVRTAAADLANWGGDWTRSYPIAPAAVVFPETVQEVVALTKLANQVGLALVPSGGRTGLSGGAVASHGEVVVSFERMNRVLGFDAADRVVRCQAGVVTQALQAFAVEQGLFYPVDFASSGSSQIGGNIATNAGGIKVIRYGLTRDWIAGLTVVTGKGDVLELNRGLVKNATGYDLRHLFIGAEGTLGFVVEAEVRLTEAPPPSRVMVLGLDRFADVLNVLLAFQSRLALSAFEFFSELALGKVLARRDLARPFDAPAAFYALLEFDATAEGAALAAFEEALAAGWVTDGVASRSDAQAASLWALREGITESIAPRDAVQERSSGARLCGTGLSGRRGPVGGAALPGLGGVLVRPHRRRQPASEHLETGGANSGRLLSALQRHQPDAVRGGTHTRRQHLRRTCVGLLKRDFLAYSRSTAEVDIMRAVKKALDPNGVMNPGKLLAPD